MTQDSSEDWVRTIPLSAGTYEYCLVVDGQWMLDPMNELSVENRFGGRNSVRTVAPGPAVHLLEAKGKLYEERRKR